MDNPATAPVSGARVPLVPSSRDRLIAELHHDTWVMLRPSKIAGVGVIAVRDIPKGCRTIFSQPDTADDWVMMTRAEVDALPDASRHMVENYCVYDADHYYVPAAGFKKVDLAYFLNHSAEPNVQSIDHGACFEALRDIRAGEELFLDYADIVDGED
jgi:hypothetical protein